MIGTVGMVCFVIVKLWRSNNYIGWLNVISWAIWCTPPMANATGFPTRLNMMSMKTTRTRPPDFQKHYSKVQASSSNNHGPRIPHALRWSRDIWYFLFIRAGMSSSLSLSSDVQSPAPVCPDLRLPVIILFYLSFRSVISLNILRSSLKASHASCLSLLSSSLSFMIISYNVPSL